MNRKFFGKTNNEWGTYALIVGITLVGVFGVSWALSRWILPFTTIETALLIVVIVGAAIVFARRHNHRKEVSTPMLPSDSNQPFASTLGSKWQDQTNQDTDPTIVLPANSAAASATAPYRTLERLPDGSAKLLVGSWRKTASQNPFRRSQRRLVHTSVELSDDPLVDAGLAKKIDFTPIAGETKIFILTRLSWVSHWPRQAAICIVGLVALGVVVCTHILIDTHDTMHIWFYLCVVIIVFVGIQYYITWMHWAYRYLIATSHRLMLIYDPPFSLSGSRPTVFIRDLKGCESVDMNWLLNKLGCGRLTGETAASETDAWLRDGINYVPEHRRVAEIVDEIRLSSDRDIRAT